MGADTHGAARTRPDGAYAAALAICAALAVASAPWALAMPWLSFVFKPLATIVIIAFARQRRAGRADVRRWVLVGLVLSLGGDIALLWPKDGFLPGLVSFLFAHLAYLIAFTRDRRFAAARLPFALVAGTILALLWPGVPGALRLPVAIYVLCLASMAAQAAVLWRTGVERAGVLALGSALFVASDALLATNKFGAALPAASLWNLATYWLAQWCIASWLPAAGVRVVKSAADLGQASVEELKK
jgi:uncharacterized membrane protein YhhN